MLIRTQKFVQHGVYLVFEPTKRGDTICSDIHLRTYGIGVNSALFNDTIRYDSDGVVFEKENIYTLDSKGELLITIMSSLAQEESRSISENVTWGHRKRFADGKVSLPYKRFLGYRKGADG